MSLPRSPRRLGLYLPFILLALFCIAWTGLWFVGQSKLHDIIDQGIAREAEKGRNWACPERSISGFPFRMELRCKEPSFAGATPDGPVSANIAGLTVVARVLDPFAVIALLDGPLTVTADGRTGTLGWKEARMSARISGRSLGSLDVVATGLEAMLPVPGSPGPVTGTVEKLEGHLRQSPGSQKDDKADFDLVARFDKLASPPLAAVLKSEQPLDFETQAQATLVPLNPGKKGREALDSWRDGGGVLKLVLIKLVAGDASVEATGDLKLDAERRPDGKISLALKNLDQFAEALGPAGGLMRPLLKGGKAPLNLNDGNLALGPVPIAKLRPLY